MAAGTPGRQPPPAFEGAVGRRAEQGTYEPRHRCSPPGAPAVIRGSSALPLSGSADDPLRSGTFLGSAAAQRARGASSRTVDSSGIHSYTAVSLSNLHPLIAVSRFGIHPLIAGGPTHHKTTQHTTQHKTTQHTTQHKTTQHTTQHKQHTHTHMQYCSVLNM